MMSATTTIDMDQRLESLDTANDVRTLKARVRIAVRDLGREGGARFLADMVENPPARLRSPYVWQVVQWVPRLGEVKAKEMLRAADIDPWCKVGRMTVRQRVSLAARLRVFADGEPATSRLRPPATAHSRYRGPVCSGCGEHMRRVSESGRCGFCVERLAA